jgi:hypothetical protein
MESFFKLLSNIICLRLIHRAEKLAMSKYASDAPNTGPAPASGQGPENKDNNPKSPEEGSTSGSGINLPPGAEPITMERNAVRPAANAPNINQNIGGPNAGGALRPMPPGMQSPGPMPPWQMSGPAQPGPQPPWQTPGMPGYQQPFNLWMIYNIPRPMPPVLHPWQIYGMPGYQQPFNPWMLINYRPASMRPGGLQ